MKSFQLNGSRRLPGMFPFVALELNEVKGNFIQLSSACLFTVDAAFRVAEAAVKVVLNTPFSPYFIVIG